MDSNDTDTDTASDATSPHPGNVVAETSASEGIQDDNLANTMDTRIEPYGATIHIPFEDNNSVKCPFCERMQKNFAFINPSDLDKHFKLHHLLEEIQWACSRCNKSFSKLHNVRCHYAKCRRPIEDSRPKQFQCESCPRSFTTQRGLSTHERLGHPAIRNMKRQRKNNAGEPSNNARGLHRKVWSDSEIELLKELNITYANERFPNVQIARHITNKTYKQISDKRKELRDSEARMARNTPPALPSSSSSSEEEFVDARERPNPTDDSEEDYNEWHHLLMEAINENINNTNVPVDIKDVHSKLSDIWRSSPNNLVELSFKIDIFISDILTPYLLIESDIEPNNTRTNNCTRRAKTNTEQEKNNSSNRNKNINNNNNNKNSKNSKSNTNQRKKFYYARCQQIYKECPKRLAEMAVNGDTSLVKPPIQPPPADEIRKLYQNLWETPGPNTTSDSCNITPHTLTNTFLPIRTDEIIERIKKIKTKAAGGPDGLQKRHLCKPGVPMILATLYNILLYSNHYPECWKINRTTLIPKVGKDLSNISNWRPITISSMLSRAFSAIIDTRLRTFIVQNMRQKGFTSEDGCKYNIALFNEAIDQCKLNKGGMFTVVDVSKAFDSIPHSALSSALAKKGVPKLIINLITKMYENCTTEIKAKNKETVKIKMMRGVKQGDPLSPLLFNLCMEPLLDILEEESEGINVNETNKVPVLAFADDIVLLGKDLQEAQKQLNYVNRYLDNLGMRISEGKSSCFEIITKKDTWYISKTSLSSNGETIPNAEPDDIFKYLGANVGPWKGLYRGIMVPEIIKVIKRVRTLYLKPQQKLDLLTTYILPRFTYGLLVSPPCDAVLKLLDSEIRQQVKEILHLVPSTTTGFFYTPKANGGLGLPKFEHIIKLSILKTAIKMRNSIDPAVALISNEAQEKKYKTIANSLRINWPATVEDIDNAKKRLRRDNINQWLNLTSQGHGVKDFMQDRIGNSWLMNCNILKPSRFIDAIRLRTNTFGTKVALARANKRTDVQCRRCHAQPETLGHILGLCVHTKRLRIKRHDEIKNFIADKLATIENNQVLVEPSISVGEALSKPDLIINKERRSLIVDVTVRYENRDYLKQAYDEKIDKYTGCLRQVLRSRNLTEGKVLPIIVGSRGAIPPFTRANLIELGIPKKDIRTIALIALRSSIEISNIFLDYDKT